MSALKHDHNPLNADFHGGICPACEEASEEASGFDPDVDIGLLFISQAIDPLHELPADASTTGDRGALAARVALWDDIMRKAGDLRDLAAQALGDLMEADSELIDTVGRVTREHPVKTTWKRDDCLKEMRAQIATTVAKDLATGEIDQLRYNVARTALDQFSKVVSPPNPTVGGCKTLDLDVSFYKETVTDYKRWSIKIVAER